MNLKFSTMSKKAAVSGVTDNALTFNYENRFGCTSREKLHVHIHNLCGVVR